MHVVLFCHEVREPVPTEGAPEATMSHQLTLPTTGYTDAAKAYNAGVREQGHGLVIQGREWISFGPKWIRFMLDGKTRRITWAQFHAGAWS